jgi:arylsulfatase A-like enzyme
MGSHGGGSPAELHNTLIANGPSFKSGLKSRLASGNIDIAPTVLKLLGLPIPDHFDGRVLSEALEDPGPDTGAAPGRLQESPPAIKPMNTPMIKKTRVGKTEYLCELG